MASDPITSWQINGERMEIETLFSGTSKSLQMVTGVQTCALPILEKAEEPEIKLPTFMDHQENKRIPGKYLFLLY